MIVKPIFYPFGMALMNTSSEPEEGNYRFAFNGMEKDDEVSGDDNSYDFGARFYNPRVGRWLSGDPHERKYPGLTPYNFVANTPLRAIDPDGKDIIVVVANYTTENYPGHMVILVDEYEAVEGKVIENGIEVTRTYYRKTGRMTAIQNLPNEGDPATEIDGPHENMKNSIFMISQVSYTLDEDGKGIKGQKIGLEKGEIYYTEEEVKKERKILQDAEEMRDLGTPYDHDPDPQDVANGEVELNDCSTIIVELLSGAGLINDPEFGLTTITVPGTEIELSTPTPNQIGLDLKEMGAKEEILGDEEDQEEYMTSEKAENYLLKQAKAFVAKTKRNLNSNSE